MVIEVVLDGHAGVTRLIEAEDFKAFKVIARAPCRMPIALQRALGDLGAVVDGTHLFVRADALAELAGDRPPEWRESFEAMLEAARRHGWTDDSGAIRAHIEWELDDVASIDAAAFRHVLGHLPTGVTVVTADTEDGPVGMACNSLTSVSLEPPLVALCPGKTSETWPLIRDAGSFVVNVMASHHEPATRVFARKDVDRFDGIGIHRRVHGHGLDDAVAWIECLIDAEHDAGDHTIVVGRVMHLEASTDAQPLVFFRGAYGTFATSAQE